MIGLLVLVEHLDVVGVDVARPLHVKVLIAALDHVETRILTRVDHGVVDVSGVRNLERHEEVVDFVALVLANAISRPLEVHIARIGEKSCRRSIIEDGLEEEDLLCMWLEHGVRQASFLSLYEHLV